MVVNKHTWWHRLRHDCTSCNLSWTSTNACRSCDIKLIVGFALSNRTFIRHVVFFSAADESDVERIVAGLSLLRNIPHASVFEVVRNSRVDQLSDEVDVVVYAEFVDDTALQAYKAHPIYQQAIDIVRPLREMRIAADF